MHCGLCGHTHTQTQINTNQPTKRSRRARSGASSLQSHNPSSGEAEAEERLLQVPGHPGLQNKTLSQIPNKLKGKPASPVRAKEEPVTRSRGLGVVVGMGGGIRHTYLHIFMVGLGPVKSGVGMRAAVESSGSEAENQW